MTDLPTNTVSPHYSNHQQMSELFQWMPISTLVINKDGSILDINQQALLFFGASASDSFLQHRNFGSLVVDVSSSLELLVQVAATNKVIRTKMLLRKNDFTVVCVDVNVCLLPLDANCMLFQFSDTPNNIQVLVEQMFHSFRHEIQRLKPYLNKAGRELLQDIENNNALELKVTSLANTKNQLDLFRDERIQHLIGLYPQLTNTELTICAFLSLKMTIEQIASLTGKTNNCLRVSFHRILRKCNMSSGKELIRTLENF